MLSQEVTMTQGNPNIPVELVKNDSFVPKADVEIKQRGKKMMSHLLTTLTKFKAENEHNSEIIRKRQEIDTRLSEKLAKEKQDLHCKLEELEKERLSHKRRLQEDSEPRLRAGRNDDSDLCKFEKTVTKPEIFYCEARKK